MTEDRRLYMNTTADTAFPFTCSNTNCNCIYDVKGFAEVYDLWGYIFMICGDKCIIGLTCPSCQQTTIRQFPAIPQDFLYNNFENILMNTPYPSTTQQFYYIKFSPNMIDGCEEIIATAGTEQDDIYSVPDEFTTMQMPPELSDDTCNIRGSDIPDLLKAENSQNTKVFPRMVRYSSVYTKSDVWLRKLTPGEELTEEYLERCHNSLEVLCNSKFPVVFGGISNQHQNTYNHLIPNDLTLEEYNDMDHDFYAWKTDKFKTGIFNLLTDYQTLRNRKDFELICHNELINKYARTFYYNPSLIAERKFEDEEFLDEALHWEEPIPPEQFDFDEDGNAYLPYSPPSTPTIPNPPQQANFQTSQLSDRQNLPTNTPNCPLPDIIERLNKKHAIVDYEGQTLVMNEKWDPSLKRSYLTFSKKKDFIDKYANKLIPDPENPKKIITEADFWWKHVGRRTYKGIVFDPGKDYPDHYNLWRGFAVQPVPGDWSLFQNHILNILASQNNGIHEWIMAWMARIVQDPGGDKPGSAIVLRGGQGTGKTFFAKTFGSLFGKHYLYLSNPKHLTGQFNHHQRDAILVFADEGFLVNDKKAEGILKSMVTEDVINIEQKYRDVQTVKNHINLIIASNNSWIVPAGRDERRFFVVDMSEEQKQNKLYFGEIERQMNNGGREAMMYDLMHLNYSHVDLRTIPITEAQFEQKYSSMSTVEKFWYEKLCDGILYPGQVEWEERVPNSEIYNAYKDFVEDIKFKNPSSSAQVGVQLNKLCRGIREIRPHVPPPRIRYKIFPPLNECRRQFEALFKMEGKIKWEQDYDGPNEQHSGLIY